MKKILLSMLMAGIMIPAIAQQKSVSVLKSAQTMKVDRHYSPDGNVVGDDPTSVTPYRITKSLVYSNPDLQEIPDAVTKYDMQSQGNMNQLISVHKDGFIGMVWTKALNANDPTGRGIAYSYSNDNGHTWSDANPKIGNIAAYWPSYCAWGANGELVVARTNKVIATWDGLVIMRRPNKGIGDWEVINIPYPNDAPYTDADGNVMVWSRVCSTGANNEYIHVITGLSLPGYGSPDGVQNPYHGTKYPVLYNRSSNGGDSWDFEWKVIQEETDGWDPERSYTETYTWAVPSDNHLAFTMQRFLDDGVIVASPDNGETWEKTTYYKSYLDTELTYAGTNYPRPMDHANVAFDKENKLHVVFPYNMSANSVDEGYYTLSYGAPSNAIGYWNENRDPYDTISFGEKHDEWKDNFFVWPTDSTYLSYYISGKFTKYVIGQAVSVTTENPDPETYPDYDGFTWPDPDVLRWSIRSYHMGGAWGYPQIIIDDNSRIHVCYLGVLDGKLDSQGHLLKHVFYTYSDDGGETWEPPVHVTNDILMDESEFAYLGVGGIYGNDIYYFAQVDEFGGIYVDGVREDPAVPTHDHAQSDNGIFCIILRNAVNIKERDAKSTMEITLIPNPASSSSKVSFEGKATVEVRNIIGQLVYKVENVTEEHHIPLTGLASGAYLVTVRNGKTATTQKLIVQ